MGIGSKIKDAKRIFSQDGSFEAVNSRISNLETHEYKITYYEVVSGTSGTLTVPSQGTINADEFGLSGNAILSKIDVNGKPTFESPVTSGGSPVTASLNVLTGAWVASAAYTDTNVALIYSIKINALYYDNLVYNNIIETVKVTADIGTTTLQSVTDAGNTTTNTIETAGYVKTGGTSSQFLKADGSVDSNTYLTTQVNADWNAVSGAAQILNKPTIPTQVVPAGGTTGQILAKVDDTDYNLEWIENYANYTSVLKHTVKAGEAISKGQAVYVSSADGTNMIVSKASNTSEATSSKTMGLLAQTLATNGKGFVITEGLLDNVNTLGATAGDPVWLGTSGNLIFGLIGKPYAPAHLVFIGIVTRVSATVGEIFVKVQNGFELNEIHDVDLKTTTPINGHILGFNGTLWVNKTIAGWLGYTPYDASNPSGFITSSALTPYLTSATAASTYYPLTNPSAYISGITSGMVTTALGYTPYNATNPSGFITSSALTPYLTINDAALTYFPIPTGTTSQYLRGDGTLATFPTIPTVTPSALTKTDDTNVTLTLGGSPSTALLAATSITVGWTGTLADSRIASAATWNAKQDALSGTGFVKSTAGVISYDTNTYLTSITSSNVTTALGYTPVNDSLPKIYHVLRWFTPSSTVSSSGTTVTSIGTQFTSGMVNAKLTILGEARIITAFISSTQVTVASAYSTNYSGVASGSWGVYNIAYEITNAGFQYFYGYNSNNVGGYERVRIGSDLFCYENTSLSNYWQLTGVIKGLGLNNDGKVAWSSTNNVTQTKDLGLWRNSAGVLEINDGSTVATGLLANRRDLLVRNVRASSLTLDLAPFTITGSNNTGQTASTAVAGINYLGGTRQWATGNITTQSENVWGGVTYSFVGASTITNAYGNVFNAATAGTNATITNNWAAQFNGKVQINGNLTNNGAIDAQYYLNIVNPNLVATAAARIQVTNGAGNASVFSIGSNGDAVDPSMLYLGGSNKGILFTSNSVGVLKVFDATRNITIQNGGTFTDNGYRLDVQGTANVLTSLNVGNYATPSAQRIFTVGQDTAFMTMGSCTDYTPALGLFFGQTTFTTSTAAIHAANNYTNLQATGRVQIRAYGATALSANDANLAFSTNSLYYGAFTSFTFTKPNNTGQTASTSIAGLNYVGGSRQWATGNIGTQSENVWGATTYSFVGASTITNAYGNVFNAPIAGTNATITNNWAAQFNGQIQVTGNIINVGGQPNIGTAAAPYGTFFISNIRAGADMTFGAGYGTSGDRGLIVYGATRNVLIQNGGTFADNGFRLDVNGTGRFQNTLRVTNNLIAGFNTTPRTGTISDGVTSVLGNLQNFTTNYHSGEVLYSEVSGEALNFGQLCYRNAAGKWQKATGSSAAIAAYNMLGICLHTVGATDTATSILIRGYVESTYLSAGAVGNPLFMDATTAGSITDTAPSTAGNIVRIIGNVFWSSATQTNSKWIVYFNPDNTWIEL